MFRGDLWWILGEKKHNFDNKDCNLLATVDINIFRYESNLFLNLSKELWLH